MNTCRLVFMAFNSMFFVLLSQMPAAPFNLSPVPESLPADQRYLLSTKREELLARWATYEGKETDFFKSIVGIKVPSPEADAARKLEGKLQIEGDGIMKEADNFHKSLKLSFRVMELDKQISETGKQLRGLGFERAEHAFTWFKGQSERAQQEMISQIIGRVRDYTVSKSESHLQESFLARIRMMKPKEINKLADSLRGLGANETLFQEWLRSYSPKASRKVLVDGAKLAIEAAKAEGRLFKISEEMDKNTVQGQQEAALTVITMLGADYPVMKELKLVASGFYDAGEALVTIYFLNRGISELTAATETQLANQKEIILHMKALVDERKMAQEKLAMLLSPN